VAHPLGSALSFIMRAAQAGISTLTPEEDAKDRALLAYLLAGRRPELRRASGRNRHQGYVERPADPAELDPYDALLAAGGRQRMDALAAHAGVPAQRIANTVTVLRRLLSVEGYQSVTVDSDGQTVVLDERMLRDQFGLGVPG
jgi:hypothetical protein